MGVSDEYESNDVLEAVVLVVLVLTSSSVAFLCWMVLHNSILQLLILLRVTLKILMKLSRKQPPKKREKELKKRNRILAHKRPYLTA